MKSEGDLLIIEGQSSKSAKALKLYDRYCESMLVMVKPRLGARGQSEECRWLRHLSANSLCRIVTGLVEVGYKWLASHSFTNTLC